jgi:hypothetical protein
MVGMNESSLACIAEVYAAITTDGEWEKKDTKFNQAS